MNATIPLARALNFVGCRCTNLAWRLTNFQNYHHEEYFRWVKDDPHELLRITYPLNRDSLVVDVGGLTGDWASRIYCRYNCNIDIYEPCASLAQQAIENFEGNNKITVFPVGLSDKNGKASLYGDYMEASLYQTHSNVISEVDILKASEVFNKRYSWKTPDLVKINTEGAEYEILPDLIEEYDMRRIRNLQIQFHPNIKDFKERRAEIRKRLSKTHVCSWCYDFVFENWVSKVA